LTGRERGDQLIDPDSKPPDLGVEALDLVEQHLRDLGVVGIEAALQGLDQGGAFDELVKVSV
jgi:hypothetical protein